MMTENSGFSFEQSVVFKLGQIETALGNISRDVHALSTKFDRDQETQDKKIEALEAFVNETKTNHKVERAKIRTAAAIIGSFAGLVGALIKGILEKWPSLSFLH